MFGKETQAVIKFIAKSVLLLMPALTLVRPAFAFPPAGLSDSAQPGSVIVYPKFVNMPAVTTNGDMATVPRTEIEIGAVCPPAFIAAGGQCAEHQSVTVLFQWVCPGAEGVNSNICPGSGFAVNLSVNGKLAFSADGIPINGNSPVVPAAPCPRGYLIGSAISDQPNFDGLIGNAVIRGPNLGVGPDAGSSTAVSAYQAITIQAGTTITGVQFGDVKYDKTVGGAPAPTAALSKTYLILLTLDVRSNQPNYPTFVPLKFYNESLATVSTTNPNFERLVDANREFLCWDQVSLASDNSDPQGTGPINTNLTQAFMQTRKGIVIAGPAQKTPELGIFDTAGPVTLIGLVETIEGTAANSFQERKYDFNMSTNGIPVP
jgi:hypothetical protein